MQKSKLSTRQCRLPRRRMRKWRRNCRNSSSSLNCSIVRIYSNIAVIFCIVWGAWVCNFEWNSFQCLFWSSIFSNASDRNIWMVRNDEMWPTCEEKNQICSSKSGKTDFFQNRQKVYTTFCFSSKSWVFSMHCWVMYFKNPLDTGRAGFLIDCFPNAKFIYIHRNPIEVFYSTRKMWKNYVPTTALEVVTI